ncbi:MAG: hypothetical protein GXP31_13145 [Kiritimatiellaeota bacterium]|nr:hypothetical protein [Kiritimatiellota bacterium]
MHSKSRQFHPKRSSGNESFDGGLLSDHEVYKKLYEIIDGEGTDDLSQDVDMDRLKVVVYNLLKIRIANEKGFDILCLKIVAPEMTHEDIARVMTAMGRARWNHRARSHERVKKLLAQYPQLQGVMSWDTRGAAPSPLEGTARQIEGRNCPPGSDVSQ